MPLSSITSETEARRVLSDHRLRPAEQSGPRALMARFSTGTEHRRRRGLVVRELSRIDAGQARRLSRERTLERIRRAPGGRVDIMGALARRVPVGALAAMLRRHHPATDDPEVAANRLGILIQARDATAGLIGNSILLAFTTHQGVPVEALLAETLRVDPPVRNTARFGEGTRFVVDLASAGLPFGAGAHACPGRDLAMAIAAGVVEVVLTGRLLTPVAEYEDWPNLRIPVRLEVHANGPRAGAAHADRLLAPTLRSASSRFR